jgi:hypothetical protein
MIKAEPTITAVVAATVNPTSVIREGRLRGLESLSSTDRRH